jgi:uncharacterized membrane protein (UPF0127 family)
MALYDGAMRYLVTLLLMAGVLTACHASDPTVELNGQRFAVEIAADDATRTRGLMFRESMPSSNGMLFIFEEIKPLSFWMKNTKIPLDIFYFDNDLKLVNVVENARPCRTSRCPSYPSTGPARFVLELNAGSARALGTKPGDQIQFINVPKG